MNEAGVVKDKVGGGFKRELGHIAPEVHVVGDGGANNEGLGEAYRTDTPNSVVKFVEFVGFFKEGVLVDHVAVHVDEVDLLVQLILVEHIEVVLGQV